MKTFFLILFLFPTFVFSQKVPKFSQYPVNEVFIGKNAKVIITKQNRMFRTRLQEAAKEKVNFAGHYIFVRIGCGTSCEINYVIDAKTGKVYSPNFSICCEFDYENPEKTRNIERMSFRVDSNLIVFAGMRNESEPRGFHFYKFENGQFKFIKTIKY